jgi:signal transduction histidine kinase
MWHHRFLQWLRSAPISDPVDRRNAPVMQLLLLFYGLLLPVNWAWRIASGGEVEEAWLLIFLVDMLVAALALVGIALIRKGRFRPAVVLFLAPQLISLGIVFSTVGVLSQSIDPAPTMLTLVISGLVLGRRALWITYGLLMAVFAIGFATDANRAIEAGASLGSALVNLPAVLISYTLITIVLDRSIKALRESLAESDARGLELQREMAERERAQSQLIHAQKMEASGRLASGIAHDFNNILGVILGFSSQRHAQEGDGPDVAALQDSLEGVEIAARRGAAISRKLLRFGRHDVAHVEVFDAARAIDEVRPMLRQLFDVHTRLHADIGSVPLPVRLDRSQFELMLLNIAANARDAMPDGGAFTVTAMRTSGADGNRIEIRLADTGHGMSDAVVQRAFEAFYSTKPADSGTGLGLAVVRDLVENAGGRIGLDSVPGHGTTFRISLPAVDPFDAIEPAAASPDAETRIA